MKKDAPKVLFEDGLFLKLGFVSPLLDPEVCRAQQLEMS